MMANLQVSQGRSAQGKSEHIYQNLSILECNLDVGRRIAGGSTCDVYEAKFKTLDDEPIDVAVKLLKYTTEEEEKIIPKEIIFLKGLEHRNIIKFIGLMMSPGKPLSIVTELAEKGSLYDYLKKTRSNNISRLAGRLFIIWTMDAAYAIHFLQKENVAHRDIKSLNFVITSGDVLKLCDFGIAKNMKATMETAMERGTVRWMAPEVFKDHEFSFASDIYSFGIVVWELHTCDEPFEGMTAFQVMWAVGTKDKRPEIPQDCPENIRDMLIQCWQADHKVRPKIDDIVQRLELEYQKQSEAVSKSLYATVGETTQDINRGSDDKLQQGIMKAAEQGNPLDEYAKIAETTQEDNTRSDDRLQQGIIKAAKQGNPLQSLYAKIDETKQEDNPRLDGTLPKDTKAAEKRKPLKTSEDLLRKVDNVITNPTYAQSGSPELVEWENDSDSSTEDDSDQAGCDSDVLPPIPARGCDEDVHPPIPARSKFDDGHLPLTPPGDFDTDADLPSSPSDVWETSEDRLGKLYVAIKDYQPRVAHEIKIKRGETVELTEIDFEDGTWHVRVTLGTSLDKYTYSKRVGWVPANCFTDYTGPDDRRKSRSLIDVRPSVTNQADNDEAPGVVAAAGTRPGPDKRLSRTISDLSDQFGRVEIMSRHDDAGLDISPNNKVTKRIKSSTDSTINRRTGSWRGGTVEHHHLGHKFLARSIHVPVKCFFCNEYCSFSSQKVCEYRCSNCHLVVHKGCHDKILNKCRMTECRVTENTVCLETSNQRLGVDLPHRFKEHTWKVPSLCKHCGGLIIGLVRQGLKCAECGTNIHYKCKPSVANTCRFEQKDFVEGLMQVKQIEKSREEEQN